MIITMPVQDGYLRVGTLVRDLKQIGPGFIGVCVWRDCVSGVDAPFRERKNGRFCHEQGKGAQLYTCPNRGDGKQIARFRLPLP